MAGIKMAGIKMDTRELNYQLRNNPWASYKENSLSQNYRLMLEKFYKDDPNVNRFQDMNKTGIYEFVLVGIATGKFTMEQLQATIHEETR